MRSPVPFVCLIALATSSQALAQVTGPQEARTDPLRAALDVITRAIEIFGIGVIIIGGAAATAIYLFRLARGLDADTLFRAYRASLGRAILLGLEFLVAADIIGTVAIEPTLESLAVLAGIVLIRTFLSFSLEVEIDGRLPWRKEAEDGARPQER